MDPIMRHTAHMKNLVFPLLVGQNRKMNQASGDSHRIHLPHQGQVCSSERNPAIKESNRIFDELFIRTSLQNREFSLIIMYVGGAGAS